MSKIIALDYDNTIVKNSYPEVGEIRPKVLERLKQEKRKNNALVSLWTCRTGTKLDEAVEFMDAYDIPYDYVNFEPHNPDWKIQSRKIYADEYWDDKALNVKDIINEDINQVCKNCLHFKSYGDGSKQGKCIELTRKSPDRGITNNVVGRDFGCKYFTEDD